MFGLQQHNNEAQEVFALLQSIAGPNVVRFEMLTINPDNSGGYYLTFNTPEQALACANALQVNHLQRARLATDHGDFHFNQDRGARFPTAIHLYSFMGSKPLIVKLREVAAQPHMRAPSRINPNTDPHNIDLTVLNRFIDFVRQVKPSGTSKALQAIRAAECLKFIKVNEAFIRYALEIKQRKNKHENVQSLMEVIYQQQQNPLDHQTQRWRGDMEHGVMRAHADSCDGYHVAMSFHLAAYELDQTPAAIDIALSDLKNVIAQFETHIVKMQEYGLLNNFYQKVNENDTGCVDDRIGPPMAYAQKKITEKEENEKAKAAGAVQGKRIVPINDLIQEITAAATATKQPTLDTNNSQLNPESFYLFAIRYCQEKSLFQTVELEIEREVKVIRKVQRIVKNEKIIEDKEEIGTQKDYVPLTPELLIRKMNETYSLLEEDNDKSTDEFREALPRLLQAVTLHDPAPAAAPQKSKFSLPFRWPWGGGKEKASTAATPKSASDTAPASVSPPTPPLAAPVGSGGGGTAASAAYGDPCAEIIRLLGILSDGNAPPIRVTADKHKDGYFVEFQESWVAEIAAASLREPERNLRQDIRAAHQASRGDFHYNPTGNYRNSIHLYQSMQGKPVLDTLTELVQKKQTRAQKAEDALDKYVAKQKVKKDLLG